MTATVRPDRDIFAEARAILADEADLPPADAMFGDDRPEIVTPPAPRRWQSAADVIEAPPPETITEGVAWAGCLTVLVGESGSGKSFVVTDLGAAVDADLDWHGRHVRHGSVIYIPYEGHAGLRLRALRDVAGYHLASFYIIDGRDPLSPVVDRDRVELPGLGEIDMARHLDQIVEHVTAEKRPPVVLVTVDTVRGSLSGSEDSSEAVSAYLRAVRRLMRHTPEAGWILVHHAGWQDSDTRRKRERGSSSFRGNVDATLYLEADEYDRERREARLTLSTLKVRDGEPPAPLHLIRRQVEVPGLMDRWGQPVTSCIIGRDRRSREDREAEQGAKQQAAERAVDVKVLRVLRDHADATSLRTIRAYAAMSEPVVRDAMSRILAAGWATPPAKQRHPYTLTGAGLAAVREAV